MHWFILIVNCVHCSPFYHSHRHFEPLWCWLQIMSINLSIIVLWHKYYCCRSKRPRQQILILFCGSKIKIFYLAHCMTVAVNFYCGAARSRRSVVICNTNVYRALFILSHAKWQEKCKFLCRTRIFIFLPQACMLFYSCIPPWSCFFPVRNVLKTANQRYILFNRHWCDGIDVNFTTREERVTGSCVANKSSLILFRWPMCNQGQNC